MPADIPERAAERLVMDYPVETTERTTTKTVKGPAGKTPQKPKRPKSVKALLESYTEPVGE